MDETAILVLVMMITIVLLYIIGMLAMLKSVIKYKYSPLWLIVAALMLVCPSLIFVLYSYREKAKLKETQQIGEKLRSEIKYKGMVVLFLIYYIVGLFLVFFLKYVLHVEWGGECALVLANVLYLLFLLTYVVYIKKQIDKLLKL
jgi:hypothetical protein